LPAETVPKKAGSRQLQFVSDEHFGVAVLLPGIGFNRADLLPNVAGHREGPRGAPPGFTVCMCARGRMQVPAPGIANVQR